MYICVCNALNDRDVKRAAADGGAARPADVFRFHGCAPQCGKCACHMRTELARHHHNGGCCGGQAVAADQAIAAE
ncbi:bacterioferritin-associated ferredoxin [Thalassospira sp.]|uniref:(2Fe-2S)-binding protein n=1 Tax=Thalassospira sp. TaxID=1912094 RepID=UPI002732C13D|nr:(2Fe-2S)-binding protein [Thalassospira sp.]MDP2700084.1 (2Fe-2S)-binding protein [Thalassospira sp.]